MVKDCHHLSFYKDLLQRAIKIVCISICLTTVSYGQQISSDTTKLDSADQEYQPSKYPTYNPKDRFSDAINSPDNPSPLLFENNTDVDIDIDQDGNFSIQEKKGKVGYRPPSIMSFDQFNRYQDTKIIREYWKGKSQGLDGESPVSGKRIIPKIYLSPALDRIFGGSYVDIRPNGYVTLDFGGRWQRQNDPRKSVRQQKNGGFNYDQQMGLNIVGNIGQKLTVSANFDNNNTFDFQNNMKIEYSGLEEDIIKKLEIGNVSLPTTNSLIRGSQALFGVKADLQFGKLFVTTILSRQQGKSESITLSGSSEGGGAGQEFTILGSNYMENRLFFLGHYFRENYENWLSNIPNVRSPIRIPTGRVEVYKLSRSTETEGLRSVIAFTDLGEDFVADEQWKRANSTSSSPTANGDLWNNINTSESFRSREAAADALEGLGLEDGTDYEIFTSARKLDQNEFTVNQKLGYLVLNSELAQGEAIAVSYEYTENGVKKEVGELTEDYGNQSENEYLFFKLLRGKLVKPDHRTWDLMMKNAYQIGSSIDRLDFEMKVYYRDDGQGLENTALNESVVKDRQLINLLGLDQLNSQQDAISEGDGNFDFIEDITIDPDNGYVIFPYLEPFGSRLRDLLESEPEFVDKYVYDTLYRDLRQNVFQITEKNKFSLKGRYTGGRASGGGSGGIQLPGFNIAEGSVIVTAGGTRLLEGSDYTVNYAAGTVNILNPSYASSGKDINISYEKSDLFNFRSRWMTGTRFDYKLSDDVNFGATYLQLNERPGGISRYQVGQEPVRNRKYGLDFSVDKESRFLTKMLDKLPLISTKENSNINVAAEFAQIIPGTTNKINGEQTSFIDDFEGSVTPTSLGAVREWKLGSTPINSNVRNDFGSSAPGLESGFKRAKLAWYQIDRAFFFNSSQRPSNFDQESLSNHYQAPIEFDEIFKNRDAQIAQQNQQTFDLAYFPEEKGPYNYQKDLEAFQNNPEENFGAITRSTGNQTNFSNVQYIEFWMMDPFIEGDDGVPPVEGAVAANSRPADERGELVFNLGLVSEDVLPDSRHAFENGLPTSNDNPSNPQFDINEWGIVTSKQYLNNAFSENERASQDVGLDGLNTAAEAAKFYPGEANPPQDPSGDDFRHYFDPAYASGDFSIVERYRDFNGMEGNTNLDSRGNNNSSLTATIEADNEDINDNNTLESEEKFFEYRINLSKNELQVGKKFIVGEAEADNSNRKWYLVRIPIHERSTRTAVNDPKLTEVQFLRMYMTGFKKPVVLRMVKFQMVSSQWQKYDEPLSFKGLQQQTDPVDPTSNIEISVVNIEENSEPAPGRSPYTLPPGISRDRDNTTARQRRDNEQSMQICVKELKDGDAKAVYKSASLDLINYGRLKMFLHAEDDGIPIDDDEVLGFIRLMRDRSNHYYEIEIPLKVTREGAEGERDIWPEQNEIDLALAELKALKVKRDDEGARIDLPYEGTVGKHLIRVVGKPVFDDLNTIMIGVRNPKDDGVTKSVCIWANELRLTDFDDTKGWAGNIRFQAKLADIGRISVNGRYTSFGFGSLDQNISDRTREESFGYDVTTTLQMDKLIPGKHGLNLPMTLTYEKDQSTPKFDPRRSDIELETTLSTRETDAEKEEYKRNVQDRRELRGIAFNNVSKQKVNPDARNHIWDIENFNVSYSFQEEIRSNYTLKSISTKRTNGAIGYNFDFGDHTIQPFKNWKGIMESPWLGLLKEFNFNPLPSKVSMDASLNRRFKRTIRFDQNFETIDPIYEKFFSFNRNYALGWNLTKSINLNYTARANAVIDEPEKEIDTDAKKDSIWNNLKSGGRLKNYSQTATATYQLPLDKFPLTDFLSANASYNTGMTWVSGADDADEGKKSQADEFGHSLQNNRERSLSGKVDMNKLYNKVKFLKEINQESKKRPGNRGPVPPRSRPGDTTKVEKRELPEVTKGFLRLLMTLKDVNFSFNQREGTVVPGFMGRPKYMGLTDGFGEPGWDFAFGSQDPFIMERLTADGDTSIISTSAFINDQFSQTVSENMTFKTSLEPFKNFRIQLDAKRTQSSTYADNFRQLDGEYQHLTPNRTGSYNISFNTINTSFDKINSEDNSSEAFETFINNIIAIRDAEFDGDSEVALSQEIIVPAFIAAYSGKNAVETSKSKLPKIPIPNWKVDWGGLGKLKGLSERFSSITIRHGYSSDFSIGDYNSTDNTTFENANLTNSVTDILSESSNYLISQVSIMERFTPLIGIDIKTKKQTNIRFDYKRSRNLALLISNHQLTEDINKDYALNVGFAKKGIKLPFKTKDGSVVTLQNDLQFRMAVTVRDSRTTQRSIVMNEEGDLFAENTITAGRLSFKLSPSMTYTVNDKVFLTAYVDRSIEEPRISTRPKTASTAGGIQLRFSLAQ